MRGGPLNPVREIDNKEVRRTLGGSLDHESSAAVLSAHEAVTAGVADPITEFALSVVRGLSETPKRLDCRYLYDAKGSDIFERITEQPEYYLTRTESSILQTVAEDIAMRTGDVTLIELGSGSSTKTQLVLEAYARLYGSAHYTPVDVSRSILEQAEQEIHSKFPMVKVNSVHGTYDEAFPLFDSLSPSMLLFLGSTVGNLDSSESALFWQKISDHLLPGDFVLLGVDISRDPEQIDAAYNDAAGHSAAFTQNLFNRINRELGACLDLASIEHAAEYSAERRRVEIFARFAEEQVVDIAPFGHSFTVAAGEKILTEISRKFDLSDTVSYLRTFGFTTQEIYTDDEARFSLLLIGRV